MGYQPPVPHSEKREQLQSLCCPPQVGVYMVYIHATADINRWNTLGFEETHLIFLIQRVCRAGLQCLAFRCLQLGVRRRILNVSLQLWILNEGQELYLTPLSLIRFF